MGNRKNTGGDLLENKFHDYRQKIGQTIREIREKKGISQEHLAEKMQISRSTISKIENGRFNLSLDYLSKFAHSLNFEVKLIERDL